MEHDMTYKVDYSLAPLKMEFLELAQAMSQECRITKIWNLDKI